MKKNIFNREAIEFVESSKVKEGVVCDVYRFNETSEKDLGVVHVQKGCQTPLQLVVGGKKTLEIFQEGKGVLTVTDKNENVREYHFPSEQTEVEVKVGEKMQWTALEDMVFAEVCYPPYQAGRFRDIST